MDAMQQNSKTYTIREAAKISGLTESTLRYYETIGLIDPIERDASSKYRVFSEGDINLVIAIACLNATGLSIEDMRQYLKSRHLGAEGARDQVQLLEARQRHLQDEIHYMQLRQKYVQSKIAYWKAVELGDNNKVKAVAEVAYSIARQMKLPKPLITQEIAE